MNRDAGRRYSKILAAKAAQKVIHTQQQQTATHLLAKRDRLARDLKTQRDALVFDAKLFGASKALVLFEDYYPLTWPKIEEQAQRHQKRMDSLKKRSSRQRIAKVQSARKTPMHEHGIKTNKSTKQPSQQATETKSAPQNADLAKQLRIGIESTRQDVATVGTIDPGQEKQFITAIQRYKQLRQEYQKYPSMMNQEKLRACAQKMKKTS